MIASARNADALLLSAGQLVGKPRQIFRLQRNDLHQPLRRNRFLGLVPEKMRHIFNISAHVHVRGKTDILNDVADASAQGDLVDLLHILAGNADVTGIGKLQSINHFQKRRFAAA